MKTHNFIWVEIVIDFALADFSSILACLELALGTTVERQSFGMLVVRKHFQART